MASARLSFGSDFQRLPRAAGKPAGAGRRRIHRKLENPGWRADFDCGARIGNGAGSAGSGDEVCEAAETVWAGDQRVSGGAIQAGGHGDPSGSGTAAGLPGGVAGGQEFIKDYPAEKYYRDVKLCTIGEGTSEIQKLVIARQLLGKK